MRIRSNVDGTIGSASKLETIDAHSSRSGDFTERRTVQGKQVFLTVEGAAHFDQLSRSEYRFDALDDPKWLYRFLAPREKFTGSTER